MLTGPQLLTDAEVILLAPDGLLALSGLTHRVPAALIAGAQVRGLDDNEAVLVLAGVGAAEVLLRLEHWDERPDSVLPDEVGGPEGRIAIDTSGSVDVFVARADADSPVLLEFPLPRGYYEVGVERSPGRVVIRVWPAAEDGPDFRELIELVR